MDLIAFGGVFLEIVFGNVRSLPEPGEEIYADEFAFSCGGGAVTAAGAASRLGARAGLATMLGDDPGSRAAEEYCRRAGVDLSPSRRQAGWTAGITVVLNFAGDRAFVSYLPPRPPAEPAAADFWPDILRRHRPAWCYAHARPGLAGFLREARSLGVRVALDVALNEIDRDREAVVSCARMADIFLPNEAELLRLTGAGSVATAVADAVSWCPLVVVKRGPAGVIVADKTGTAEVTEGLRPVVVRDRTGAGDAFAGALIGALCQGASTQRAAAAGNQAGSDTVGKLGAVGDVEVAGLTAAAPSLAAAALLSDGAPGHRR